MFKSKGYKIENYKFSVIFICIALSIIGLIVLRTLTITENQSMFSKQLIGLIAGLVACIIVSFVDYHFICKFCIPLYILNLVLMLMCKFINQSMVPFFYGKSVDDARRWIHIGPANGGTDFMPSEITKLVLIIVLARIFVALEGKINKFSSFMVICITAAIPVYLVFDQPDLSTSIVLLFTFAIMFFVAGLSFKYIIPILATVIPAFFFFMWYIQQPYGKNIIKEYQRNRILSITAPDLYPDLMYQQNRGREALEAGKLFGKMLTDNDAPRLSKYVPVVESDFIFSAVGEEFGFVGTIIVIVLFLLFFFLSLKIAFSAKDKMGLYIATGIASMITLQAFVNIGVVVSLLPNTGIPLPFMSSGLSSLLTNFATIGVLINVGLQKKGLVTYDENVIEFGKYHRRNN